MSGRGYSVNASETPRLPSGDPAGAGGGRGYRGHPEQYQAVDHPMSFDLRAATIEGSLGKVRLIWRDGELRAFNSNGLDFKLKSDRPRRVEGFRAYEADTEAGTLKIQGRCWTCGGHARVALRRADDLWNS